MWKPEASSKAGILHPRTSSDVLRSLFNVEALKVRSLDGRSKSLQLGGQ